MKIQKKEKMVCAYLSPIKIPPRKPIIIIRRKSIHLDPAPNRLDLAEKSLPDAILSLGREFAITKSDMYAGLEGRVESLDAIGGEEEDALEVFQEAEEDADEGVAGDVLGLASL